MRRGLPYFLLFSIYAIVNTYLPIMLRTFGFSAVEIGILLSIIEIAGVCVPFFITAQLDKTGQYGWVMCFFGLDVALLLLPLLRFRSFFIAAICLGIFAAGFKGLVPVLDGFTAKALGQHDVQYGKIRSLGSVGFVCSSLFLQLSPLISGQRPVSVIIGVSTGALLFVATLRLVPDLRRIALTGAGLDVRHKRSDAHSAAGDVCEVKPTAAESVPVVDEAAVNPSAGGAGGSAAHVTGAAFPKPFWECLVLIFLAFLGLVPCQRFFSLYVEEYVKLDASAGLWALSAMAEIPMMIISGKLIRRFGRERLLAVCLFSITVRNLSYVIFPGISGAVIGQLLHSLSFGLFHPLSVLLCVSHSSGRTATSMMFFTAVNGAANVIGSAVGGYIIEYAGYPALFLFFGLFPLIGVTLYFFVMHKTLR